LFVSCSGIDMFTRSLIFVRLCWRLFGWPMPSLRRFLSRRFLLVQVLVREVAQDIVYKSATTFWLIGFHSSESRAELRRYSKQLQHADVAAFVSRSTNPALASAVSPTTGRLEECSPASTRGAGGKAVNRHPSNMHPPSCWQPFAHSRATADLVRSVTKGGFQRACYALVHGRRGFLPCSLSSVGCCRHPHRSSTSPDPAVAFTKIAKGRIVHQSIYNFRLRSRGRSSPSVECTIRSARVTQGRTSSSNRNLGGRIASTITNFSVALVATAVCGSFFRSVVS